MAPPPPPPPPPPAGEQQQPQLHGVVIISLPPPDQPSKGKTITAFTYSDDPAATPPPQEPAMGYAVGAEPRRRSRRRLSARRVAVMALVLGALAVAAYYCFYSDVAVQFLGMEQEEAQKERNETRSFLLPLYPKARQGRGLREFGDVKLAAKRVDDGGRKATNKMEVRKSAAAGNNSTALLPIKGNVFPDGYAYNCAGNLSEFDQYYTSFFVGNPPRPYFLDVDTGSDLTWVQCDAPCTNCANVCNQTPAISILVVITSFS
ncbi:hypothetical protein BAE44_0003222 [Dichanthelium oligosanthes]|uniref:Peptidase A1 domain-containing protein n=1 Tax=Dichanthelium oligosanthes TaxID=888268 RepID=A0A1E5WEE9_9POAL|nr:hypothetical protein BAE44_0003222 [Dichanthelium oligosanthes]